MTTDEDLCPWSDLPRSMCAHCHPEPRPHPKDDEPAPPTHGATLTRPGVYRPQLDVAARALLGLDQAPIHMADIAPDLDDYLTQLAWPMASRQTYELSQANRDGSVTRIQINHPSKHLPLISQLWQAGNQAPHEDEGARPGYASKPTARIDALDAHARIDSEAARWVRNLGDDDADDTIGTLRHLKGMAAGIQMPPHKPTPTCCYWHMLERDARSWWIQCRVLTGWDSAAWRPDTTCPPCGVRGSLRVKLMAKTAMCVECREVWDEHTIGLLADHIRDETEAERFTNRATTSLCRCTWPQEPRIGRVVLCPECGSRYCAKTDDMIVKKLLRHVG